MLKDIKQKKIIDEAITQIKEKYPEIALGDITSHQGETWVDIIIPEELFGDEKYDSLVSRIGMDILENSGYYIGFHSLPHKAA